MEYLQPGLYTIEDNIEAGLVFNYQMSHEAAAGLVIGAWLNRNLNEPESNETIYYGNDRNHEIHYDLAFAEPINPEFLLALHHRNLDEYLKRNNLMLYLNRNQNKRYAALLSTKYIHDHERQNIGAIVQFDTPDFISGLVAYFRDFSNIERLLDVVNHLVDRNSVTSFDIMIPLKGNLD